MGSLWITWVGPKSNEKWESNERKEEKIVKTGAKIRIMKFQLKETEIHQTMKETKTDSLLQS
jgi:hypothetical protein